MNLQYLILENLSKNIYLNNLSDKITIIPNPLYTKKTISEMNMSNIDIGGALSTFKEDYSHDGKKFKPYLSLEYLELLLINL